MGKWQPAACWRQARVIIRMVRIKQLRKPFIRGGTGQARLILTQLIKLDDFWFGVDLNTGLLGVWRLHFRVIKITKGILDIITKTHFALARVETR